MTRLPNATLATLQRQLRRGAYHIFHFVGHGGVSPINGERVLYLEDERGCARLVSGDVLGTLLNDHRSLRLALLNACEGARVGTNDPFAGVAQHLVLQGIPAIIAMQFEITDDAAILLAQEFYAALADGYPVEAALAEARKAIFVAGHDVEWGTPVLYSRASDGHLFNLAPVVWEPSKYGVTRTETPETTPTAAIVEDLTQFVVELKKTGQGKGSKYAPLSTWLLTRPTTETHLRLSFDQVEQLMGKALPNSARTYRAWWANDSVGHNHAQAWLSVGWRVVDFDLTEGRVTFKRANDT